MTCERIGNAIVCGGRKRVSKEQLPITPEQEKFLESVRKSVPAIALKAAEADRLGFGVLAREYDYIAGQIDRALTLQLKALKKDGVPEGFK